ncbi:MAG: DUF4268 domain-containing protein [Clostridia bacterium]|nr:DUF4268 domain-containing protein [Bacilli bacterium]MBR3995192.1 DUF4268 domain-containing protein [Clostridia bacterium]
MTQELTPKEILKSKKDFSDFIETYNPPAVTSLLAEYPQANGKVIVKVGNLTQNTETFGSLLNDSLVREFTLPPYITWFVVNEKEEILNQIKTINKYAVTGFGIFVFKVFLNDDKIDVKCILKPELKPKKEKIKTISKTGGIQLDYWNVYAEVCDEMGEGDYQIKPASQHYQNIPIGLKGAYIKQTISVKDNYVASELFIGDNKQLFADLKEHEKEIEKELGTMIWDCKDSNKSCFIRRMIFVDFTNPDRYAEFAKQQIELAIKVRETFFKYI